MVGKLAGNFPLFSRLGRNLGAPIFLQYKFLWRFYRGFVALLSRWRCGEGAMEVWPASYCSKERLNEECQSGIFFAYFLFPGYLIDNIIISYIEGEIIR